MTLSACASVDTGLRPQVRVGWSQTSSQRVALKSPQRPQRFRAAKSVRRYSITRCESAKKDFSQVRGSAHEDQEALQKLASKVDVLNEERQKLYQQLSVLEATYAEAVKAKYQLSGTLFEEEVSYGYTREAAGCYTGAMPADLGEDDVAAGDVPRNMFIMGKANFERELKAFKQACRNLIGAKGSDDEDEDICLVNWDNPEAMQACISRRRKLRMLTLDDDAIWARERARPEIAAPWVIKLPYFALCYFLDFVFKDRPIQRFWFLETVARMPYFSYTTMLYVYETLGWWRRSSEMRKVHFAEEWNEYHHLLIMESLGGDVAWRDRFMAQHAAIVYYWILVLLWVFSPTLAYNFSELIEAHAVDTYAQFVDENRALLDTMAAPRIARQYYMGPDMYLFDEFQTAREARSRRPQVDTLLNVFENIRDDEAEHVNTMAACQDREALVQSPNAVAAGTAAVAAAITVNMFMSNLADLDGLPEGAQAVVDTLDADGMLDVITGILSLLG